MLRAYYQEDHFDKRSLKELVYLFTFAVSILRLLPVLYYNDNRKKPLMTSIGLHSTIRIRRACCLCLSHLDEAYIYLFLNYSDDVCMLPFSQLDEYY